ncbi:CHAT domain-containing protein [Desertifilum sp. FACHB-1129]|uniref:CHAT domain-containing protein n=1 Tax=Desertifilum tharense IPPAS B-1220 TaxID=1781255 RepID=A0A1E5QHF7_9CYAN|nr:MULTISPECIES: CHAT domain-containing protein [Desertifilum]MDA0209137.1 CHAT domain-containing protein [Cyanobacteria bacterium FC1]MBD2311791.1 CHAT domain-containing protein [Desertifilum sp. FACHB-1129]MBD2325023.1 CHAT domain-containing protein [Desertifilum sp. FACHB-866]MBD2333366.1 CHAT domain-containing protein [Desertifilum sp. FACHB-868]OEJ74122.1 hypothetical protein BH720_16305 [Desertifilum tharense IPPAS B-1220]
MARKRVAFLDSVQSFLRSILGWILLACLGLGLSLSLPHAPGVTNPPPSLQLGQNLYREERYPEAIALWQQVIQTDTNPASQALAWNYLALAYQKLGEWQQAESAIAQSLALGQTQPEILARIYNTQGHLNWTRGQVEPALENWQLSTRLYQQIGDASGELGSKINQAQALQALGLHNRATTLLSGVQQQLQASPASLLKSTGLRSLGNAFRVAGELDKSQAVLEASLQVANQLQDRAAMGTALLSLGNTQKAFALLEEERQSSLIQYNERPDFCRRLTQEQAIEGYKVAANSYQNAALQSPHALTQAQAKLNYLNALYKLNQTIDANEIQSLQSLINRLNPSRATIYAQVNFAQLLACQSQGLEGQSQDVLKRAIAQAENLGDRRSLSYALGKLAQFYETNANWQEATQLTQQALEIAEEIQAPDIAYQWQWQLGRIARIQNNLTAINYYKAAFTNLQKIRTDLVSLNPDVQFSFRDEIEPIYRQLAELLLQAPQPSQENLQSARVVIEALQLAELNNFFRDSCLQNQPENIDRIDPTVAVFYTIALNNKLAVIIKPPHQNQLAYYSTPISRLEVSGKVEDLKTSLQQPLFAEEDRELSEEFYQILIQKAENILTRHPPETLVFVLDDLLRNLPMSALFDGERYLIEKYPIAQTPGIQLLQAQRIQKSPYVLAAGVSEANQGQPPLPGVIQEIENIQSYFPRTQPLINEQFTKNEFNQKLNQPQFSIVHLATHGQFSSQVENTFLLVWQDTLNIRELNQLLQERSQIEDTPIQLLVLSACQTAAGDRRAALGLAGVAVRSGARSTIATLWLIPDESTAKLTNELYQLLAQPISLAKALQTAQISILREYTEPYYWAAYTLIGNWR